MGSIGVDAANCTDRIATVFQLMVANGYSGTTIATGFPVGLGIAGPIPYFVIFLDTFITGFTLLGMDIVIDITPIGVFVFIGCGDIHLSGGATFITLLGFSTFDGTAFEGVNSKSGRVLLDSSAALTV